MTDLNWQEVEHIFPDAWGTLIAQLMDDEGYSYDEAEAIAAHRNTFTMEKNGRIWCESDVPSEAIWWNQDIGWCLEDLTVVLEKVEV